MLNAVGMVCRQPPVYHPYDVINQPMRFSTIIQETNTVALSAMR